MQVKNSLGQTIEAEWISGPTMMDKRMVIKMQPSPADVVAAFFDGASRIAFVGDGGKEETVEGYSVLVAMTRKDGQDGWLVSLAKA